MKDLKLGLPWTVVWCVFYTGLMLLFLCKDHYSIFDMLCMAVWGIAMSYLALSYYFACLAFRQNDFIEQQQAHIREHVKVLDQSKSFITFLLKHTKMLHAGYAQIYSRLCAIHSKLTAEDLDVFNSIFPDVEKWKDDPRVAQWLNTHKGDKDEPSDLDKAIDTFVEEN